MFGLGNLNSSIYVFLVVLSWVLWFCGFVGNFRWKRGKNVISIQSRSSSPRRRSAHLGEPEVPNLSISTTPRRGLLRLSVGPHLGKGPLRLGEPEVLFCFLSSVNFRNHQSD